MSFFERYEECCKKKGILPVSAEAANMLGITKGAISHMAKSGTTPRGDVVRRAAEGLGVSADFLLGIDVVPLESLTTEEKRLLAYYRKFKCVENFPQVGEEKKILWYD